MSATLTIAIDDADLMALAEAADEEGRAIGEMARLIVKAAVAVYRIENADRRPAGPMSHALRPRHWQARRWRVDEEAVAEGLAAQPAPPVSLGDPPPGRSALDARRAAEGAGR